MSHYVIDFERGFDSVGDVTDAAVVMGIVKQKGAGFSYIDTETGEVLASGLGKKRFKEKLTPELLERIEREVLQHDN